MVILSMTLITTDKVQSIPVEKDTTIDPTAVTDKG